MARLGESRHHNGEGESFATPEPDGYEPECGGPEERQLPEDDGLYHQRVGQQNEHRSCGPKFGKRPKRCGEDPAPPITSQSVVTQSPSSGRRIAAEVHGTNAYGYASASPWPTRGKWNGQAVACGHDLRDVPDVRVVAQGVIGNEDGVGQYDDEARRPGERERPADHAFETLDGVTLGRGLHRGHCASMTRTANSRLLRPTSCRVAG